MPNSSGLPARSPLQLFVHCATSVDYLADLNESVPGVDRYAERALLLAEPGDVVCVPDAVEPAYLEYLAELGLGPAPGNLVVASRFEHDNRDPLLNRLLHSNETLERLSDLIRRHGAGRIHPFMASPGQIELAATLEGRAGLPVRVASGDPAVTTYADYKHHIRAKAIALGVPVAPGEVVDLERASGFRQRELGMLCDAMERQIQATGKVIVRGTSGGAGSATFAVEQAGDITELAERLAGQGCNRIYLVESMVDVTVSPNVQMHIDEESRAITCQGVTDQRWVRTLVHGGNRFPSSARRVNDMIHWAGTLAEWLRDEGFVGLVGFDFVEYTSPSGQPEAFLAEMNPRINGATYPLRLASRLNRAQREAGLPETGAFVSGTVETEARTFAELRDLWEERLFSRDHGAGLIPYVTGLLAYGKVGVVALAADLQEANELYHEAAAGAAAIR